MSENKESSLVVSPESDISSHVEGNPSLYAICIIILGVAIQSWFLVAVPVVVGIVMRMGVVTAVSSSKTYHRLSELAYHFFFDYLGIPDLFDEGDSEPQPSLPRSSSRASVRRVRPAVPRAVVRPMAPSPSVIAPKRDLMPLLANQSFVLVHGAKGAGKTTLLCHLMDKCEIVVGCNPHHEPGVWPPHVKIFGKGYEFQPIFDVLMQMEQVRIKRHKAVSNGYPKEKFKPVLIVMDETLSVFSRFPHLGTIFQNFITEADKVKMGMVLGSHTSMVDPLGLKGRGDLLRNLAVVDLTVDIDGERTAVLKVGKYTEPVSLPGRYATVSRQHTNYFSSAPSGSGGSQAASGGSQAASGGSQAHLGSQVPDSSPNLTFSPSAGDRSSLIQNLLLMGWGANDIAGVVKGRRSDVLAEIRLVSERMNAL